MNFIVLTKNKLPQLLAVVCCLEALIYLWSVWTTTFEPGNFFGIEPEFVYDKCARIAGRISSVIIFVVLIMVGHCGLKIIYKDAVKKETFLVLISLFSFNHLIHLLFVLLNLWRHQTPINFEGPVEIGGMVHGVITFGCIVIIPVMLWIYPTLNPFRYGIVLLHLLNVSSFIIKTFLTKVNPPDHPAYHNQLGILAFTLGCVYVLFRVMAENVRNNTSKVNQ